MRYILPVVFSLFLINTINAQTDQIKKIKELYYSVNEENYMHHDLELHHMYAAIGEQTKKIRFYFVSEQSDPENDPYEMEHDLVKMELNYNISASVFYTIEYLYDLSGDLLFFYEKTEGYEISEKRYYFNKGKLIKCIVKDQTNEDATLDYTDTNNFKEEDLKFAENVLYKSGRYKHFFDELNKGADIY